MMVAVRTRLTQGVVSSERQLAEESGPCPQQLSLVQVVGLNPEDLEGYLATPGALLLSFLPFRLGYDLHLRCSAFHACD